MLENILILLIAGYIIWKIGFKVYEDYLSINDNNTPVYKKIDLFRINQKITEAYSKWVKYAESSDWDNNEEKADKVAKDWDKYEKIYRKMIQTNIDVSLGKKTVQEAWEENVFDYSK